MVLLVFLFSDEQRTKVKS